MSQPVSQTRKARRPRLVFLFLLPVMVALTPVFLSLAGGQQIRRDGFEGREPLWVKGPADATSRELAHRVTDEVSRTGQRSETIQLQAETGSFIHYLYDCGRAPISEEMSACVHLKANRPGLQFFARLVLPHENNPKNLQEPLTALLRGDLYQTTSRWQRLEIRQPLKLVREQQQLLQAEYKRPINIADAYVDRLILNVYSGPGEVELWIDDLEVGPVLDNAAQQSPQPAETQSPAAGTLATRPNARRPMVVELDQKQLKVSGKRVFFRAIRRTDTPLRVLRDAGFNTVYLGEDTPPEVIDEAVNRGFYIVPSVPLAGGADVASGSADTFLTSNNSLFRTVSRFAERDGLLFWDLGGGGLALEQAPALARTAQLVRATDSQRPLAADVWDGFAKYSGQVQMLGVHRWPLMTALELTQYRDWLTQRRQLADEDIFLWTWVQTHLPDWHTNLVYERSAGAGFQEPVGPLPEQIRLLTYTALGSGCKGIGFWSDRFLADSHQGRDRLLMLALLNQEMQMLEPLLVAAGPPTWVDTSVPEVKAAVLRCEKAILVLPIWMGKGAQFVPGQGAKATLTITVPQVPPSMQPWDVSPAEVRALKVDRITGGTQVTLPEFALTAAIVFTADNSQTGLVVQLQNRAREMAKPAAQWAHDLANVELEKVTRIEADLEAAEHRIPEGQALLEKAQKYLASCVTHFNDRDYPEAYQEALRAQRPLAILMRAQWEEAAKDLDAPVASPYAVSYFSLPKHWKFVEQLKSAGTGANALPNGDFELATEKSPDAWTAQEVTLDEVDLVAQRVAEEPHDGQQCLKLEIKPKKKDLVPGALERTFLAINSPAVRLEPGTLVKLSGWVRIPKAVTASADGALLYDSAGGEPLAIRLLGPAKKWKQFTWYRRVPPSGTINMTVALTGIGAVYFDDLKIEPLTPGRSTATAAGNSLRSPKVEVTRNSPGDTDTPEVKRP